METENHTLMEKQMIDIKKIIKEEGHIRKFDGIAPEGFVLVHEKTLEDLRNIDIWLDWKMSRTTIKDLNKKNFDNT
jgi:hypothetical protein